MNLMKVKFKWRTAHLDLDPNDPAANDETDAPAVLSPPGIVTLVNTVRLFSNSDTGYWYVNDGATWWPWPGDTTFKVRVKQNGSVGAVLWKRGPTDFVPIGSTNTQPAGVARRDTCTIEDGNEPGSPPAPCRWVVQGGKAYKIC